MTKSLNTGYRKNTRVYKILLNYQNFKRIKEKPWS